MRFKVHFDEWDFRKYRFCRNLTKIWQLGWFWQKNYFKIFSSETSEPNLTKPCRDGSQVVPYQNYILHIWSPCKMAVKFVIGCILTKKIFVRSFLKPLGQFESNLALVIIWFWKESLNSDGQQFHQYRTKQTITYSTRWTFKKKMTMTYMHCNFKNVSDIYITHLHIHKSHFTPNDLKFDV